MEIEQEQLWKLVERLWAGEVVPPASDGALGAAWGWTMGRTIAAALALCCPAPATARGRKARAPRGRGARLTVIPEGSAEAAADERRRAASGLGRAGPRLGAARKVGKKSAADSRARSAGVCGALRPVESVLLGILIVSPLAIAWHFAAPYYFLSDDLIDFYRADHVGALSYLFEPGLVRGHLSPLSRFAYLALGRVAPMNFDVALASLLAFHAVSAVLLQRILTLLFGRAWWTYALALAWAISIAVYLPAIAWFAAGVHSITAITATLASIHGYLCWRTTGRRVWIIWSVAAMCIGLGFHEKAILIPFYLFLMRVLLLDPAAGLLDSLRSLQDQWRVWLAYATVCALYLVVYFLGGYSQLSGGFTGRRDPGLPWCLLG